MLTEEFGKRLRYWRKKRGMTLTDLHSAAWQSEQSAKWKTVAIFPRCEQLKFCLTR